MKSGMKWEPGARIIEADYMFEREDSKITVKLSDRGRIIIDDDSGDGSLSFLTPEQAEALCSELRAALAHARGEK